MLACVLEAGGYGVDVLGGTRAFARQATRVGRITIETGLGAQRRTWRRPELSKRLEIAIDDALTRHEQAMIVATDPLALHVSRAAVLRAQDRGVQVALAYDRGWHPGSGTFAGRREATSISHVERGIAASLELAMDDCWPAPLRQRVPIVYPAPLELIADPGRRQSLAQPESGVGIFLPPHWVSGDETALWELLRGLEGISAVVLGTPRQLRWLRRRGALRRAGLSARPLPDEDDVPNLVSRLPVVVCPSVLSPDLPPTMVAVSSRPAHIALVASQRVLDELGSIGYGVDQTSPVANAAAVRRACADAAERRHMPRVGVAGHHSDYAGQLTSLRRWMGVKGGRKLGIGPRNGNGQGWAWAQALRALHPDLMVEVFAAQYTSARIEMTPPSDVSITMEEWKQRTWQLWWAHRIRTQFTHLLIEQGLTACGLLNGGHFFHDVPHLLEAGLKVGLVFRGSEIRDPAGHAERERWSPFQDPGDPLTARLQKRCAVPRQKLATFAVPKFVTTLDLLDDVPDGTWLPQALDLDEWPPGPPILARSRPVVLHAPTSGMKGSHWIDDTCGALHDEGLIEYVRLHEVPFTQMPARIRAADIVVDQLALGSYGVLAVQAMASERLVIGHVSNRARARVPHEIPVLQAEPPDLRRVIEDAVAARDWSRSRARAGRDYVRRYHSGEESAERLIRHLLDP